MVTKEIAVSWLHGCHDVVAVLIKSAEWGETRWGIIRRDSIATYKRLFPDNEILEIVRADGSSA